MARRFSKIDLSDHEEHDEIINVCYESFKTTTFNKSIRPLLFGKVVSIPVACWISQMAEIFWHMASIEVHHRFDIFPCNNDSAYTKCDKNCIRGTHQVTVKGQLRNVCYYRAQMVHWVNEIILMANEEHPDIKWWKKPEKLSGRDNLYIRYQHEEIDYLVIFAVKPHKYELITGYPIFYINSKAEYDKDYAAYHKKIKSR